MPHSDKSQTKIALYVFAVGLLCLFLAPFALIGAATAPVVKATAAPRDLVTPVCERAVLNRYPTAKLNKNEDWLLSQNSAGNYRMLARFTVPSRLSIPELRWCTVQPVNGAMQLVSLS